MNQKKLLVGFLLLFVSIAFFACQNSQTTLSSQVTTSTTQTTTTTTTTTPTTTTSVPTDCDMNASLEGGWELVFCDSFDGETLNTNYWTAADHIRHGSQVVYYSNRTENVRVADGKLVITGRKNSDQEKPFLGYMPYSSARLESKGKFDFTYGRVIVRAKVAPGAGTWPAIWMLPTMNVYGNWPRSGEIDIMEYVGRSPGSVSAAYHTEKYNHMNTNISLISRKTVLASPETTFNDYELIWTSESLTWLVNGKVVHFYRYNNRLETQNTHYSVAWPFDQSFHLILNLGMGDAGGGGAGPIDPNLESTTFEVEYVKVYQINYDLYDESHPTTPEYVEQSNWNPLYFLWPRSSDDFGVSHYEFYVDDTFVGNSPVNSYLLTEGLLNDASIVKVRAVDFTGKMSNFVVLNLNEEEPA